MIYKINNHKKEVAEKIHSIFQVSYAVEAKILKVVDFPPLKRQVSQFLQSENHFYAYKKNKEMAAVIEIDNNKNTTHIQSLVVYPKYFRQGIASKLVAFILKNYESEIFTVETGADNVPAIKLYQSFNFKETKQYDAEFNIRKIKLELKS